MVGAPTPLPGAQVPVLLEYERAEEWVRPQWGLQPALPPRLSPELTSGGGVGSQLLPVGSHSGGGGRKAGGDKARLHTCRPRFLRIHTSMLVTCRARHYCLVTRKTQDSLTSWTCPRAEVAWLWSLVASGHHTPTPVSSPPGKSCGQLST